MALSLQELKNLAFWFQEIRPNTDKLSRLADSAHQEAAKLPNKPRNPRLMLGVSPPVPLDREVWDEYFGGNDPEHGLTVYAIDGTVQV